MFHGLKMIVKQVKHYYCLGEINNRWRLKNKHNFTSINSECDISKVTVGKYTYGQLNVHDFKCGSTLKIGNYCSIADEVHFFLGGGHHIDTITTYPLKKRIVSEENESLSKGDIVIEDDVWIGSHVLILPGVKIGRGCIIAAGSVVTKDIEPYSIVGGVPAKLIKKRFSDRVICIISDFDFKKLDKDCIASNLELFYEPLEPLDEVSLKDLLNCIIEGMNEN